MRASVLLYELNTISLLESNSWTFDTPVRRCSTGELDSSLDSWGSFAIL